MPYAVRRCHRSGGGGSPRTPRDCTGQLTYPSNKIVYFTAARSFVPARGRTHGRARTRISRILLYVYRPHNDIRKYERSQVHVNIIYTPCARGGTSNTRGEGKKRKKNVIYYVITRASRCLFSNRLFMSEFLCYTATFIDNNIMYECTYVYLTYLYTVYARFGIRLGQLNSRWAV